MANKKLSKRQEKKMKKLQEKREKALEKEQKFGINDEYRKLKKKTSAAIYDIDRMTSEESLELITKIACASTDLEISTVPKILKENKEENLFDEKIARKDKTYNRTVTRVYYAARENVSVLKGKYIVFIFVFIAFFTLYFTSNTLSRYAGTTQGNGSMQVAKWNVGLEQRADPKTLNIVSGTSANYVLEVKSASEVATNYNISLSNVPDDVQVQLDGGTAVTPTNGSVIFEDAGSFNANNSSLTRNHILTFTTTLDTVAIDNNSVNIDVVFVQEEI